MCCGRILPTKYQFLVVSVTWSGTYHNIRINDRTITLYGVEQSSILCCAVQSGPVLRTSAHELPSTKHSRLLAGFNIESLVVCNPPQNSSNLYLNGDEQACVSSVVTASDK